MNAVISRAASSHYVYYLPIFFSVYPCNCLSMVDYICMYDARAHCTWITDLYNLSLKNKTKNSNVKHGSCTEVNKKCASNASNDNPSNFLSNNTWVTFAFIFIPMLFECGYEKLTVNIAVCCAVTISRIFNVGVLSCSAILSFTISLINCLLCTQSSSEWWLVGVFMNCWISIHATEESGNAGTHACIRSGICKMNELATFLQRWMPFRLFANCFEQSVFYDSFRPFEFKQFHCIDVKRCVLARMIHALTNVHVCIAFGQCWCYYLIFLRDEKSNPFIRHAAISV